MFSKHFRIALLCDDLRGQDYVAALRDPGTVGKTAREQPTSGALLRGSFVLFPASSKLGPEQNK